MGLVIAGLLVLTVGAVAAFGVALARRSSADFAAQNQIVPGRPSPAPKSWAGAHTREARLHRRLGDAVRGAHSNPRFVQLGLAPQMAALDAEALAVDERLVAASFLLDESKEPALDELEEHVQRIEATVAEIITSVSVADSKEQLQAAVSAADIKLQALAEARAEVDAIDRNVAGTTEAAREVEKRTPPATAPVAETQPATSPPPPQSLTQPPQAMTEPSQAPTTPPPPPAPPAPPASGAGPDASS